MVRPASVVVDPMSEDRDDDGDASEEEGPEEAAEGGPTLQLLSKALAQLQKAQQEQQQINLAMLKELQQLRGGKASRRTERSQSPKRSVSKLPEFTGADSAALPAWITQLEAILQRDKVPKVDWTTQAVCALSGAAALAWSDKCKALDLAQPVGWDYFVQCLTSLYRPADPDREARSALHTGAVQQTGSIAEYNREFRATVSKLRHGMLELDKIWIYRLGLRSHALVKDTALNKTTNAEWEDVDSLMEYLASVEEATQARSQRGGNGRPADRAPGSKASPAEGTWVEVVRRKANRAASRDFGRRADSGSNSKRAKGDAKLFLGRTAGEIRRLRDAGRCIACGGKDHMWHSSTCPDAERNADAIKHWRDKKAQGPSDQQQRRH